MARGPLLSSCLPEFGPQRRCIGARADGLPCNRVIGDDEIYCQHHMNMPETHRDKVLFYGYLARPVRTELVRKIYSANDLVGLAAIKEVMAGIEKYAPKEEPPEDLSLLSQAELLRRAKELVRRLE